MARLTRAELARATLPRQFPEVAVAPTGAQVLALFDRLGPIQSQVPRSPFLAAASRLPGVRYATLVELFETHQLLKTSTLRGTVHTATRRQYGWSDAVARAPRAAMLTRTLGLQRVGAEELVAALESYADATWRTRVELVAHARHWLRRHESDATAERVTGTMAEALVWGHSGLVRRPPDRRWEKRTDIHHRTARAIVPELELTEPGVALTELVRVHLGAYGPATRSDIAFFTGARLGLVDTALRRLEPELVQHSGPDAETYFDLAEPPPGGSGDPGLRLLPEFDGLFFGYAGPHRDRFIATEQLPRVWATVNGLASPCVLDDGRVVATWKTVPVRGGVDLAVSMLPGDRPPEVDRFDGPVRALGQALDVVVRDVRTVTD